MFKIWQYFCIYYLSVIYTLCIGRPLAFCLRNKFYCIYGRKAMHFIAGASFFSMRHISRYMYVHATVLFSWSLEDGYFFCCLTLCHVYGRLKQRSIRVSLQCSFYVSSLASYVEYLVNLVFFVLAICHAERMEIWAIDIFTIQRILWRELAAFLFFLPKALYSLQFSISVSKTVTVRNS